MLNYKILNCKETDIEKVIDLYKSSFPENERMDEDWLFHKDISEKEILSFYDDNVFFGFCILLTYKTLSHILYFSVVSNKRNKGYGSYILTILKDYKKGYSILADIEKPNDQLDDNDLRIKRKNFYIRNGFHDSVVEYRWQDEYYQIVVLGKELEEKEFGQFWRYFSHYFR